MCFHQVPPIPFSECMSKRLRGGIGFINEKGCINVGSKKMIIINQLRVCLPFRITKKTYDGSGVCSSHLFQFSNQLSESV